MPRPVAPACPGHAPAGRGVGTLLVDSARNFRADPRVGGKGERTHSGDETGTELIFDHKTTERDQERKEERKKERKKETEISHIANCFDM